MTIWLYDYMTIWRAGGLAGWRAGWGSGGVAVSRACRNCWAWAGCAGPLFMRWMASGHLDSHSPQLVHGCPSAAWQASYGQLWAQATGQTMRTSAGWQYRSSALHPCLPYLLALPGQRGHQPISPLFPFLCLLPSHSNSRQPLCLPFSAPSSLPRLSCPVSPAPSVTARHSPPQNTLRGMSKGQISPRLH